MHSRFSPEVVSLRSKAVKPDQHCGSRPSLRPASSCRCSSCERMLCRSESRSKLFLLLQEKLQPYKIEIAKEAAQAVLLVSRFKASIHRPAMALVRCAEDVIHTVAEVLLLDGQSRERWVLDVERLKDKLHS
ncbi:hypothetical protein KUDE01_009468, partial [Dissostichus eleginoides]